MGPDKSIKLNAIVVSNAKPTLAKSLVGMSTQIVESNRLSRFVVARFLRLITAAHFQPLPLSVCKADNEENPSVC